MIKLIYLTGFMTCGKSTVGPILANTLGWNFLDIDKIIADRENMEVSEIFSVKGESYFRQLETEILIELSHKENFVIALGGGTIVKEENLKILQNTGKIIYLKTSAEIIYDRIKTKLNRPIFRDLVLENRPKEDFIERINKLLDERSKYYESADFTFTTNNNPVGLIVDQIAKKIEKYLHEKN